MRLDARLWPVFSDLDSRQWHSLGAGNGEKVGLPCCIPSFSLGIILHGGLVQCQGGEGPRRPHHGLEHAFRARGLRQQSSSSDG